MTSHVKFFLGNPADMKALIAVRQVLGITIDHETLVPQHQLVEVHFLSRFASHQAARIVMEFRSGCRINGKEVSL
jgi:hypothetical protein